ncbi:LLM class flavin-dependent oxidoreductase [Saccharopolyspora taberi]|uniref:LLM class flavin-dependent oxidoreductase n=2 Tax=Saccharopolyspora taberi TaxID=60895 RepID=A0ABN3V5B4_9PSEU
MESWPGAGKAWQRAEELGFDTAWVFDHVSWRGITPWHDGYATLTAAAVVTSRIRLGTLVTSPNFRHPVPTATAVRTIDDISGGRLTLGIGAGSPRSDAGVLGGPEWSPRERADRFAEWTDLLDRLLRGPETTYEGTYYSAREMVTSPGCVQKPRVPFGIAATGRRGTRLAARHGAMWITVGGDEQTVRKQLGLLDEACAAEGRDPAGIRRMLFPRVGDEPWRESVESFRDLAGRYAEMGITDVTLHWPRPDSEWDMDMAVFEAIAAEQP